MSCSTKTSEEHKEKANFSGGPTKASQNLEKYFDEKNQPGNVAAAEASKKGN